MNNISIMILDLPICISGATAITQDGKYHIYINRCYSLSERNNILKQELEKIDGFNMEDFEELKFDESQAKAI